MASTKYLVILTIGVCLLFSSAPAMADQSEDEAAIRKVFEQITVAFNGHDAEGIAAHWDPSLESWDGSRRGAAQFLEFYSDLFKRQPHIKGRSEEIGIVFLTPDCAVYKSRIENTDLVGKDGELQPQLRWKWLGAWAMVRKDNRWLVAAWFSRDTGG